MKTLARITSLALALAAAGLLSSCASNRNVSQRPRMGNDFEVVETSTKRQLTSKEMAELRAKVGAYLEKEGATGSGDYYVKVFLSPDENGVSKDWVVVRYTRDTDVRFSLLGSYPTYSAVDRSYLSYDYYPYGYDSFSRLSFQYYDYPYYGSRYYYPSRSTTHQPHRNNRTHDRDADHGPDRGHVGNNYNGNNRPDRDRDGDHPRRPDRTVTDAPPQPRQDPRMRWSNNQPNNNQQSRENNYPNRGELARRQPERTSESRSYTPPSRQESTQSSNPAPERYSPPAESSQNSSSSNQSSKESNYAGVLRGRQQ